MCYVENLISNSRLIVYATMSCLYMLISERIVPLCRCSHQGFYWITISGVVMDSASFQLVLDFKFNRYVGDL